MTGKEERNQEALEVQSKAAAEVLISDDKKEELISVKFPQISHLGQNIKTNKKTTLYNDKYVYCDIIHFSFFSAH